MNGEHAGRSQRILIADDNQDAANTLAMCLKFAGHEIYVSYDGHEALEKACLLNPDALIADLEMPKLDGYELVKCMRNDSRFHNTLFVALSGHVDKQHRLSCDQAGFHLFFAKPVDPALLHATLQSLWGEKKNKVERIESVSELEAYLVRQLRSRVRDLRVALVEGGIALRGIAGTYHAKQLAQELTRKNWSGSIVSNEIEVSNSLSSR